MSETFILLAMLFCHVVADYNLQGWLANAKQKEWWKKNAPDEMYARDYIMALIMHSIGWAFLVMLPVAWYESFAIDIWFIVAFVLNVIIHAFVDDYKANEHKINLVQDQLLHILQIILMFCWLICL